MYQIQRSALFKKQFIEFVQDYQNRAGPQVAGKFIDGVATGVEFIARKPLASVIYTRLQGKEFRKWGVTGFPVLLFFRVEGENVVLEAMYAHRMDVARRLPEEIR